MQTVHATVVTKKLGGKLLVEYETNAEGKRVPKKDADGEYIPKPMYTPFEKIIPEKGDDIMGVINAMIAVEAKYGATDVERTDYVKDGRCTTLTEDKDADEIVNSGILADLAIGHDLRMRYAVAPDGPKPVKKQKADIAVKMMEAKDRGDEAEAQRLFEQWKAL